MSLKTLQEQFMAAYQFENAHYQSNIIHRQSENTHYQSENTQTALSEFVKLVAPSTQIDAQQQIEIYKDSIVTGLLNSLKALFPVCEKLVGDAFFQQMAYTYITQHPSTSPNLNHYGNTFADFVQHHPPCQTLPYLADICRLEYAWNRAYLSKDHPGLNFEALAAVKEADKGKIIFRLPPDSTLLISPYPILTIWKANQNDATPEEQDKRISLTEGKQQLLIWRRGATVNMDQLTESEWAFCQRLQQQYPLSALCDENKIVDKSTHTGDETTQTTQPSLELTILIPTFVERHWIADFVLNASDADNKY